MTIVFEVPGDAVGKGRPRFGRRGAAVVTYTPEKTAAYEASVRLIAAQAMRGQMPLICAVAVDIAVSVAMPGRWSRRRRGNALAGIEFPTTKPDADNIAKGILDAMNGIVFVDDKQVVDFTVRKRYAETAGVCVKIQPAETAA